MILDKLSEFCENEAVTGAAGSQAVGDVIDLGAFPGDIGNGRVMYFYVAVKGAPTGATTVAFELVSSDAEDLSSPTIHVTTGALPVADVPAGKLAAMVGLPVEGPAYKRYLGLRVTSTGATALADLVISSGLSLDPAGWRAYGEANN